MAFPESVYYENNKCSTALLSYLLQKISPVRQQRGSAERNLFIYILEWIMIFTDFFQGTRIQSSFVQTSRIEVFTNWTKCVEQSGKFLVRRYINCLQLAGFSRKSHILTGFKWRYSVNSCTKFFQEAWKLETGICWGQKLWRHSRFTRNSALLGKFWRGSTSNCMKIGQTFWWLAVGHRRTDGRTWYPHKAFSFFFYFVQDT